MSDHNERADGPGSISVRRASRADIPALGRLGALLVKTHHGFDAERFLAATPGTERGYAGFLDSQLDDGDVTVLVAEENGTVIGYAFAGVEGTDYMSLRGPAGVLHDIVVDPDQRGRGVGRLLLDTALEFLRSRGVPRVVLWTAALNEPARHLFASVGFRQTMVEMTHELQRSVTT